MRPLDDGGEAVRRGWWIVSIPPGEKAPRRQGWPDQRLSADDVECHLARRGNIGALLGPRAGELVDADLDCVEALALADLYLPPTQAEFGRHSKPRSHRLYVAPAARYESFGDPLLDGKNTIVELRAAGRDGGAHQTLLPPSVADGERREWHGDIIAPAVIEAIALRTALAWLAIGVSSCATLASEPRACPARTFPVSYGKPIPRSAVGHLTGSGCPIPTRCGDARDQAEK
jgi:hypothetical protein